MTDQTPTLSAMLVEHSISPIAPPSYKLPNPDSFLYEAHQINNRLAELLTDLRSIRQPYLSNVPPPRRHRIHPPTTTSQPPSQKHLTDADRDAFDAEAKSVLRDLNAAIRNLHDAAQLRAKANDALAKKQRYLAGVGGVLGSWAAGGGDGKSARELAADAEQAARDAVARHYEAVVWFLRRRLELCGRLQSEMMEVRVQRELEKNKSDLEKTRRVTAMPMWDGAAGGSSPSLGGSADGVPLQERLEQDAAAAEDLDEAQMQIFTKENNDLLKHYESKQEQVRAVERSLVEISELQSTLAGNLEIQHAQIEQLVADSLSTADNVASGNKELKKASERKSVAKFVFWGTVGLCSVFVVWDLII